MAANTNPTTSMYSFLMKGSEKLVDIVDYPDVGGKPDMVDITTCSHKTKRYIPGVLDVSDGCEFTANYIHADYATLKALEGTVTQFGIWFGGTESSGTVTPTGADGKYTFSGYLSVYITGSGVGDARQMKIIITPTTDIVDETSAS